MVNQEWGDRSLVNDFLIILLGNWKWVRVSDLISDFILPCLLTLNPDLRDGCEGRNK